MKDFIYFDSAATSIKPESVLEAQKKYSKDIIFNINRGTSIKNFEASSKIEDIRGRVSRFIGAKKSKEIIFTGNSSESINMVANSFIKHRIKKDSNIVITALDHHSNYVPWFELAKEMGIQCRVVKLNNYRLDYNDLKNKIDENTLITAITGMSNLTGEIIDLELVSEITKKNSSYLLVDASQLVVHKKIDVKELGIDFLTFSAHKVYGTFGLGVLYGKEEILKDFKPTNFGGNMVSYIDKEGNVHYKDIPHRLEVGTRNPGAIFAFNESLNFLEKNFKNMEESSTKLGEYLYKKLSELEYINLYSIPGSIISFNIDGVHPHDASDFFDQNNIVVRVGNLCASPFFMDLNESGVIRVSLAYFNTKEEVDKLLNVINEIKEFFL